MRVNRWLPVVWLARVKLFAILVRHNCLLYGRWGVKDNHLCRSFLLLIGFWVAPRRDAWSGCYRSRNVRSTLDAEVLTAHLDLLVCHSRHKKLPLVKVHVASGDGAHEGYTVLLFNGLEFVDFDLTLLILILSFILLIRVKSIHRSFPIDCLIFLPGHHVTEVCRLLVS